MSIVNNAKLINDYHKLVEMEYNKIIDQRSKVIDPRAIGYSTTYEDIIKTIGEDRKDSKDSFKELRRRGFLVKLDEDSYRTLHIDVAIRSAYLRTAYESIEYIVGPRLFLYKLPIPSKEDRILKPFGNGDYEKEFYRRVKGFFNNDEIANIYCEIIKKYLGDSGFDAFQIFSLMTLLKENDILNKKGYIITAPTGAGKTEIFLLYALAKLLKNKVNGNNGKVLLTYPRKALAIDQSSRVIRLLYIANKILKNYGMDPITFGIRDGDTKRKRDIKDGDLFRGMQCPICTKNKSSKSDLIYSKSGNKYIIKCKNGHEFDFIKATKEDMGKEHPDFLISNMWAVEWRLLEQKNSKTDININFFENLSLLVIDEAHEYTGLGGGLVSVLIKLIKDITSISDFEIILSSATLPSPKNFAKKLTGLDNIFHIDFKNILDKNKINFKGERFVLMGVYDISPQYSWSTYVQLWTVMMSFLHYAYEKQNKKYSPQSLVFIQNIKEIRRTLSGFKENISLGEPKDRLNLDDPYDPYSFVPYIEDHDLLENIRNKLDSGEILDELLNLVDEIHSEVTPKKRNEIIKKLKSQRGLGVVCSTSTLELGVDYGGVSFILNSGFENPLSLRQRIGRGGRTDDTLKTTLGIILTRKVPSESFLIYDANIWKKLHPMGIEDDESELIVSYNNPQIDLRYNLTKGLIKLAQKGKNTYTSGNYIKKEKELKEFLHDWANEL
ncbi:DEAD/DEAH box helicase [Methanocaldococcus sp.]